MMARWAASPTATGSPTRCGTCSSSAAAPPVDRCGGRPEPCGRGRAVAPRGRPGRRRGAGLGCPGGLGVGRPRCPRPRPGRIPL